MTTKNPICTWDFTVHNKYISKDTLDEWLKANCKKWCYQLELGEETKQEHFQGRVSLKMKTRTLIKLTPTKEVHWTPTSNENADNDFYVCKEDTRIAGPWTDKDVDYYVPRQVREIQDKLYPWQKRAEQMSTEYNSRTINILYDKYGCKGKSSFSLYMVVHRKGEQLPYCNNFKDIMRMAYDLPTSGCYMIDIPRSISKKDLKGMFSGIEQLKNGYLFDDRYEFKRKFIDSPCIWVFVNKLPKTKYLSQDRWKYYIINDQMELVDYKPKPEDYVDKKKSSGKKGE